MKAHFRRLALSILLLAAPVYATQAQESREQAPPVEPQVDEPEEMIGTLILSDESALQVLDLLEQMTGKIILRRQDISPAKINFNSRGPITKSDAVLALESLLTLNGIMLTDMGGRFMKAVPATDVNSHVPEMLVSSALDLPPSQQIYAKLFKLDYLKAEQAGGSIVSPLLSQNSSIVTFPKSNALLITDALINLQRIENIITEADHPQSVREQIEFIKLNYVQASELQERIEHLIQGPLKSYLEGSASVTADERTNQLILITHPDNLPVIMRVIKSIDVDAAPLTRSEVFPLRQAKAEEVVPIIEDIISGQKEGREEDAKIARESKGTAPQEGGGQGAETPPIPPTPSATGAATAVSEASSSLQFSNFVGLSADERTNSIVAYGTQSDLKTLQDLIEKIDRPLPQVRIEAVITEVSLTEDEARGLDRFGFSYAPSDIDSDYAVSLGGSATEKLTPSSIDFSLKDFTLDVALETAKRDSQVKVLSTPNIVVSHNQEGVINISQSRPIVTASTSDISSSTNTTTRSSVEFRDIGIKLTVTPLIGSDGTVQMQIEQTVENVVDLTDIDGNDQPIIGKREATSFISVRDGEIIVLGGLQENRQLKGNTELAGFRRIPIIGALFGGKTEVFERTELIIFIKPTILTNPSDASQMSEKQINQAIEEKTLKKFFDSGTTGNSYLEDSFIPEATRKEEK